jgi:ABC-type sugar transport system ATPase subunit
MPTIELKNIGNHVFSNLNIKVFDGELLVVLGPNGAGKTTLLNIITGLVSYDGTVLFDGVPVDKTPTNERQIGYLFQNLALFPHLNVASNVGYSLIVTHNLADAEEMGDRIVALNSGKIKQVTSKMFNDATDNGNRSQRFQDCLHCAIDCYCKVGDEVDE